LKDHFEMVVVGGGPAGEKAAAQAANFGKSVAVVDDAASLGGALAASAVTTKAMREAALYLTGFQRRHVYGAGVDLHPQEVIDRLRARAVDDSRSMSLADSENLARHDVEVVAGRARLGPIRTVAVTSPTGGLERSISADVVLVATGSRPFRPPGIPFDDPDVLDSETARDLDRPMKSLIVVGGGAVGCEYASIFMALGAALTLIDRGKRLLPFLDAECSVVVADCFQASGMKILSETAVATVNRDAESLFVLTDNDSVLQPEKIIFAAGRAGNTEERALPTSEWPSTNEVEYVWMTTSRRPPPVSTALAM
jgi:NAD(P) transhydrogenase